MARALSVRQVPCLGQSGSLSLMEQRRVVSTKTFEPGFHWRKIVQAHHLSCCPANDNPPPREVRLLRHHVCGCVVFISLYFDRNLFVQRFVMKNPSFDFRQG
jgi:hypothetical protein